MNNKSNKPDNWFSRRHRTDDEHLAAKMHHAFSGERKINADIRQAYRDSLTDEQQLERLEMRGHGHCKEAVRLRKRHEGK